MDYKEGNLMNEGNTLYLVLFKTLYNMVIVEFSNYVLTIPYSEWRNKLPIITWKNYDLTNKDDIEKLNAKFVVTLTNNLNKFPIVYNVEIGSVLEFDYKQMILLGRTERKVLTFTLIRPILFDFNKAKEKYIVFDRMGKTMELQQEFDLNWAEYLITPFASEENIDWNVVRDRLPFEEVVGKDFIVNEFAPYPTEEITLDDFYKVIDSKKLNKIKDKGIKNEIIKLIKQTLVLAKENNSIGIKLESKEPQKQTKEEVRFNIEFTYKINSSDRDVLTVSEFVYGVDKEDALAKAPNYFYDIYEGKNYDLISVSLIEESEEKEIKEIKEEIKPVVPINEVVDENAGKTLYKIEVVVSEYKKDGGTKYSKLYDVYADNQDEALEKIRKQVGESIKLIDLYYDSDLILQVIPPVNKEAVIEKPIEETENLEDLLALYKIGETENLEDLLKLYE